MSGACGARYAMSSWPNSCAERRACPRRWRRGRAACTRRRARLCSGAPAVSMIRHHATCSSGGSFASISARRGSRKRGSFSARPEALRRLVHREARIVGRDLEQHAARLAEIDRAEIVAVLLLGHMQAERAPPFRPSRPARRRPPRGTRRDAPSRARACRAETRRPRAASTWPPSASSVTIARQRALLAGGSRKPSTSVSTARGRRRLAEQQGHAMEAADRVLGRNVAVAPAVLVLGARNADERELHSVADR